LENTVKKLPDDMGQKDLSTSIDLLQRDAPAALAAHDLPRLVVVPLRTAA